MAFLEEGYSRVSIAYSYLTIESLDWRPCCWRIAKKRAKYDVPPREVENCILKYRKRVQKRNAHDFVSIMVHNTHPTRTWNVHTHLETLYSYRRTSCCVRRFWDFELKLWFCWLFRTVYDLGKVYDRNSVSLQVKRTYVNESEENFAERVVFNH